MSLQQVTASASINNTPDAVLGYIADVRNRTFYLPSLKSITNVQGGPAGAGTTWNWIWVLFGLEFVGSARSLGYKPGQSYSFKTEGSIESTWTYTVAPEGKGTHLSIRVEYQPPSSILGRLKGGTQASHQAEVDLVIHNLKTILDQ